MSATRSARKVGRIAAATVSRQHVGRNDPSRTQPPAQQGHRPRLLDKLAQSRCAPARLRTRPRRAHTPTGARPREMRPQPQPHHSAAGNLASVATDCSRADRRAVDQGGRARSPVVDRPAMASGAHAPEHCDQTAAEVRLQLVPTAPARQQSRNHSTRNRATRSRGHRALMVYAAAGTHR
jgi:hypothetical protein